MRIRTNRPPKTREQIMKEKRQEAMIEKVFDCLQIIGIVLGVLAFFMFVGIGGSIEKDICYADAILPTAIVSISALSLIFSKKIVSFIIDVRRELLFLLIVLSIFGLILVVL